MQQQLAEAAYLLIGFSGGSDSLALAELLAPQHAAKTCLCYIHHGSRKQADEEAEFCRSTAARLGCRAFVAYAHVASEMGYGNNSFETAARQLRLRWFARLLAKAPAPGLLVLAHHADDQAETALMQLCRGAAFLHGMQAFSSQQLDGQNLRIVRPLLGFSKSRLRQFLHSRQLQWLEDHSNAVADVTRNALRLQILPQLDEIFRRDVAAIINRHSLQQQQAKLALQQTFELLQLCDEQQRLHLPSLRKLPAALQQQMLAIYLQNCGINLSSRLLQLAMQMLQDPTQHQLNIAEGVYLKRRQGRLYLLERSSPQK